MRLTGGLVLYDNPAPMFEAAITSYLAGSDGILVVADNSPEPLASRLFADPRVVYRHTGRNLGFGSGHNLAFRTVAERSDAHLVMNPDIVFGPEVLPHLIGVLGSRPEVGAVMPRIRYPDGEPQHLAKMMPTPLDLFARRFLPGAMRARFDRRYELRDLPPDRPSEVPVLSGAFMLVRASLFAALGGFDERYFMYMEDYDLVRRIGARAATLFDPRVHVVHAYGRGSYLNRRLFGYHLRSSVAYFNKWGWLFDAERRRRNARMSRAIAGRGQPDHDVPAA